MQGEPVAGVARALAAYGADPEVLEEYAMVPMRARLSRGALKFRTWSGTWALRRASVPAERLWYVFAVTEQLARAGLSPLPRFVRTQFGDPFVVHDSGVYYVTRWMSGRSPRWDKEEELVHTARWLGRWHVAAAGCRGQREAAEAAGVPQPPDRGGELLAAIQDLERCLSGLGKVARTGPMGALLRSCGRDLLDRASRAAAGWQALGLFDLERKAAAEGLVCHGDVRRRALLWVGEDVAAWHCECAHPGLPVWDLALLLHRAMPLHEWRSDLVLQVVESYLAEVRAAETSGSGVTGFVPGVRVLPALLPAPVQSLRIVRAWLRACQAGGRELSSGDADDWADALEDSLELEEARALACRELAARPLGAGAQAWDGSQPPQSPYSRHDHAGEGAAGTARGPDSGRTWGQTPVMLDVEFTDFSDRQADAGDVSADDSPADGGAGPALGGSRGSRRALAKRSARPVAGGGAPGGGASGSDRRSSAASAGKQRTAFRPSSPGLRLWATNRSVQDSRVDNAQATEAPLPAEPVRTPQQVPQQHGAAEAVQSAGHSREQTAAPKPPIPPEPAGPGNRARGDA
ncbi:MAG: hypothetical protein IRZ33_05090 [Alicyclobacillaceae bacterium]|nr:hypothetical protein [Alicyclobacillaceae bacterium]